MVAVYYMGDTMPRGTYARLVSDVLDTTPIQVGEWQAMDVSKSDLHKTYELEDVTLVWERLPHDLTHTMPFIDVDWAKQHFAERVCGQPLNPAPSHELWPYAVRSNDDHRVKDNDDAEAKFDHTYPERFWPKHAGHELAEGNGMGQQTHWNERAEHACLGPAREGVRFRYGDLSDVVDLLVRSPLTRQAYLPIWFPEDTGAIGGQRVPCTLGYHFMQRGGRLSMRYYLRACEVYRHLSNDVYFAARLLDWICDEVTMRSLATATPMRFRPGSLTMHISSLHAFVGDKSRIESRLTMNHTEALHDL